MRTPDSAAPTSRVEDGLFLPEGASLLTRLRVAVRALKVLEKNAEDSVAAPLFNACLDGAVYTRLSEALRQTQEGRELLSTRPELQGSALDLAALKRLPSGTLGHEFARYFEDNQIRPFESPYQVRNDVDYLAKRYRETHDIAHVLTGYRTDVVGEMELQAFMVGNLGIRTGVLILVYSILNRLHGLPARVYARKLREAYRRGARARQLIRIRYEHYWQQPVETLRQQFGIPSQVPQGAG